jgi:hypothetical protein
LKLTSGQRKNNLLISHINYFDRPSSKDLFYSLKNLQAVVKNQRESHIFIKAPTFYNSKLKPDTINEMFYYIFRNEIQFNFISSEKLKPTNKDEILKILREQHSTSIIGHPGFSKTYKRIKESKESYKWDNMKKDIRNEHFSSMNLVDNFTTN